VKEEKLIIFNQKGRKFAHFDQQLHQFLVVVSTNHVEVATPSTVLTSTSSATLTSSGSRASTRTTTTKNNSNSIPTYSTGENNITLVHNSFAHE
jgi:hypothetical protein